VLETVLWRSVTVEILLGSRRGSTWAKMAARVILLVHFFSPFSPSSFTVEFPFLTVQLCSISWGLDGQYWRQDLSYAPKKEKKLHLVLVLNLWLRNL
jgi:hypothetical protein